ncbi:hypothetical protein [Streptomyces sp. NPDC002619]|uniref:hypothetical protein n=1 Tax=Streptomyces sp. NPDC002619 TaxID=3364655 RepID=UPI0036B44EF6
MMKKLLAVAALATSGAALAAPAHASENWTTTDTATCVRDLAVAPVVRGVVPATLLPAPEAGTAHHSCGKGILIRQGAARSN